MQRGTYLKDLKFISMREVNSSRIIASFAASATQFPPGLNRNLYRFTSGD